jgi:predicted transcriptional regulator
MSELAKIKQSIAAEMEAARRGLHGLSAGTANRNRSLRNIRTEKGLQTSDVARAAGVPLRVVYQAEIGALVDINDAHRILHALSSLTGETHSLENVSIEVKSGVQP